MSTGDRDETTCDEGVPEILLDFDFTPDLLLHLAGDDLRLVQTLERDDKMRGGFGSREINSAEFALSERSADSEGGQR